MNARRIPVGEIEICERQNSEEGKVVIARRTDAADMIDDATEAADEMAAKSAVLVEMMEDLEERLRRRMANSKDPAPVYSRKVRRFQSLAHGENGGLSVFSPENSRPRSTER